MEHLIHMTAVYSNAVLVAILPHVSDFAKKLELPIPQPVTVSQVKTFMPYPFTNYIGGVLTLTNGDRFFENGQGYVNAFYGYSNCCAPPEDWGPGQYYKLTNFWGKVTMTTNEVIEFARNSLRKLGYDPKVFHADGPPTHFESSFEFDGSTVPCCLVEWRREHRSDTIAISINAEKRQIVRFSLISTNASRPPPAIDVKPELESDYRNRTGLKMFVRTNAPQHRPGNGRGVISHDPVSAPPPATNAPSTDPPRVSPGSKNQ
jgi:hypothetical protein